AGGPPARGRAAKKARKGGRGAVAGAGGRLGGKRKPGPEKAVFCGRGGLSGAETGGAGATGAEKSPDAEAGGAEKAGFPAMFPRRVTGFLSPPSSAVAFPGAGFALRAYIGSS
ncbi:MAG: hypothetical protein IKO52_06290, partial [Clostridia bacterium]|nr:hypothetical protein [Clostridia bacterium]